MNLRIALALCLLLPAACHGPAGHTHAHHHGSNGSHHSGHQQPIADPQQYIAQLDAADRQSWQRPDALIASLGLQGHETVADLGAGSGYFTFRFARVLPRGRVVATDVEQPMVLHLQQRAASEGAGNVQVVKAAYDDPAVPPDADLIFVCNVLHHVADRPTWFSRMHLQARSRTRLVVVDFKEGDQPQGPPAAAKLTREQIIGELTAAGFSYRGESKFELPYQFILQFDKP